MLKKYFFFGLLLSFSVFAQERPPAPLLRMQVMMERTKMNWKVESVRPLSDTIQFRFARNGWRVDLSRPAEGTGNQTRNTAEIILVRKDCGEPVKTIRERLSWKRAPEELYTVVAFPGEAEGYYFFVKSDIVTIDWMKTQYHLRNGENLDEIFAEALSVQDFKQTSARSAAKLLSRSGNRALPFIRKTMSKALVNNDPVIPHLMALKEIGTAASVQELMRAWKSGNPEILEALPIVMSQPPACKEAKNLYFLLLSRHQCQGAAIAASLTFGWGKEVLPVLTLVKREPASLAEFALVTYAERRFRVEKNTNPELEAANNIRILLLRTGDTPGSPKMINITDQGSTADLKFNQEAEKRIQPFIKILKDSPETDCAVAAALELTLFKASPRNYSKEYVARLNKAGMDILSQLPRAKVHEIILSLEKNVSDEKEAAVFHRLALRFRR